MIQATSSVNCSPIKPSFKSAISADTMNDLSSLIEETDGFRRVDEDNLSRLKDIVENIEVNPDSKIQGPLKTFVLSLFTLASGTLIARGSANKLFGLAKNKKFATSFFQKFGEKFAKVVGKASEKAAAETKGVKKYIFGGLNTFAEHVSNFAKKGIKNKKGTPVYAQKIGEKLSEEAVNTAASVAGFASTAAGLAVDKNGNGKSDILELGKNKREQEAITNLAAAVLDAI